MCGRIGLPQLTSIQFAAWQEGTLDWDDVYRDQDAPQSALGWNIKPTQTIEIAYADGAKLVSTTARWWFTPEWHRGDVKDWKATTFNARVETASDKPTFRTSWKSRRCAILASGYFEWTGDKSPKQPHWITAESNAPMMLFAGLHSRLNDGAQTCAILTRPALSQIEHIHARTPIILGQDTLKPWLTGTLPDDVSKADLGAEWDGRMKHYEVESFNIKDDGPELIEPLKRLL